jgi:hypothetical protein
MTPFRKNFNLNYPNHIERDPNKISDAFDVDDVTLGVTCTHSDPVRCYNELVEDVNRAKQLANL